MYRRTFVNFQGRRRDSNRSLGSSMARTSATATSYDGYKNKNVVLHTTTQYPDTAMTYPYTPYHLRFENLEIPVQFPPDEQR